MNSFEFITLSHRKPPTMDLFYSTRTRQIIFLVTNTGHYNSEYKSKSI